MRLATITENSVDPQDIELAKLEVPTLKDLKNSHWIYELAWLYYLKSVGRNNSEVDRLVKYFETGSHKRQHGE